MIKYNICEFDKSNGWIDLDKFDNYQKAFENMDNMIFRGIVKKEDCCVWKYVYDDEDDIIDYYPIDRKGKRI